MKSMNTKKYYYLNIYYHQIKNILSRTVNDKGSFIFWNHKNYTVKDFKINILSKSKEFKKYYREQLIIEFIAWVIKPFMKIYLWMDKK